MATKRAEIELNIKFGQALKAMVTLIEQVDKLGERFADNNKKTHKSIEKVQKEIKTLTDRFPKLGQVIQHINQAWQLFGSIANKAINEIKSAWNSMVAFFMEGVEEMRRADPFDKLVLGMDHLQKKMGQLKAKISRPFIQAFLAVSNTARPILEQIFGSFAEGGNLAEVISEKLKEVGIVLGRFIVPIIKGLIPLLRVGEDMLSKWSLSHLETDIANIRSEIRKIQRASQVDGGGFKPIRIPAKLTYAQETALEEWHEKLQKKLENLSAAKLIGKGGLSNYIEETLGAFEVPWEKFLDLLAETTIDIAKGTKESEKLFQQLGDGMSEVNTQLQEMFGSFAMAPGKAPRRMMESFNKALKELTVGLERYSAHADGGAQATENFNTMVSHLGVNIPFEKINNGIKSNEDRLIRIKATVGSLIQELGLLGILAEYVFKDPIPSGMPEDIGQFIGKESMKLFRSQVSQFENEARRLDTIMERMSKRGLSLDISELTYDFDKLRPRTLAEQIDYLKMKTGEANEKLAQMNDLMAAGGQLATSLGAAFGEYFGAIEKGGLDALQAQEKFLKGMVLAFIDAITSIIAADAARAATGASSQIFGSVPMPWALPIAAAAAAAAMAMVRGYASVMMAEGGYVTGGVRNRDSVNAKLMPGEYVMSVPQVEGVQKFLGNMGATVERDRSGGGHARGASGPVNITVSTQQLPDRMATKRWINTTILPAMDQLQRVGY